MRKEKGRERERKSCNHNPQFPLPFSTHGVSDVQTNGQIHTQTHIHPHKHTDTENNCLNKVQNNC